MRKALIVLSIMMAFCFTACSQGGEQSEEPAAVGLDDLVEVQVPDGYELLDSWYEGDTDDVKVGRSWGNDNGDAFDVFIESNSEEPGDFLKPDELQGRIEAGTTSSTTVQLAEYEGKKCYIVTDEVFPNAMTAYMPCGEYVIEVEFCTGDDEAITKDQWNDIFVVLENMKIRE